MPILGIMASAMSANLWQPQGAYDALATVTVPSGGVASITFAAIPNTYKHLQIRILGRSNRADPNDAVGIQFNSDTGNNYGSHGLWGDGSGIGAAQLNYPGSAISLPWIAGNSNATNVFGVSIIDILDYTNTNKNTTVRGLTGFDNNGNGQAGLGSGLWSNTASVNAVTVKPFYSSLWNQYSTFTLYGVK